MGVLGWVLLFAAAAAAATFCAIVGGKGAHLADHKAGLAGDCRCRYAVHNPRVSAPQTAQEEAQLRSSIAPGDREWMRTNGWYDG